MKENEKLKKKCICRLLSFTLLIPLQPLLEICGMTGRFYRFDGFKPESQPDFLCHWVTLHRAVKFLPKLSAAINLLI